MIRFTLVSQAVFSKHIAIISPHNKVDSLRYCVPIRRHETLIVVKQGFHVGCFQMDLASFLIKKLHCVVKAWDCNGSPLGK